MTYDPKMASKAKIPLMNVVRHLKIDILTKFGLFRKRYEVRRAKNGGKF